jgi:hypothetical protein
MSENKEIEYMWIVGGMAGFWEISSHLQVGEKGRRGESV